ncbi:MAG: aminotransferase class III-fold pyridoxal phosphate-dependent enzyme [Deltaproteobacteria bacterium]|nr:aminotransferase class III-fold pyridoxal phosphate-dependent enzyme [Deltaproteobacteria bacterium]
MVAAPEVLLQSRTGLDGRAPRFRSFASLLGPDDPNDHAVVLAGERDGVDLALTLGALRTTAWNLRRWTGDHALAPGASVLLVRLPGAPELPLAAATVGLVAAGMRVVLPMGFDAGALRDVLRRSGARHVAVAPDSRPTDAQAAALETLAALCRADGAACHTLHDELAHTGTAPALPEVPPAPDALVFATTGSTGEPRWLRYTASALLTGAHAFELAGLFTPDLLGGPTLVPLLSHTMGARALLHALWNRSTALFVRPEWMAEQPQRAFRLLASFPPAHVTCGPALVRAWMAHNGVVAAPRLAGQLRCVVLSGTGWDPAVAAALRGVRVANAFGTTETQQVSTTLLGGGGLGRPLPGCRLGVRFPGGDRTAPGRLVVSTPFGAAGVLGGDGALGEWVDTGDLARWDGTDIHHAGRADDDVIKTGLGVKAVRAAVEREHAAQLPEVLGLLAFPDAANAGLVGLAFVDGDPADPGLQERVREACAQRAEVDTSLLHARIHAVALVRGGVPLRGPGKPDHARAEREHAALLDAARAPGACHPHVVRIPAPESGAGTRARFLHPGVAPRVAAAGLDVAYARGEGDLLFRAGDDEPVLDLAGGYGANLLGHGHPEVLAAARQALEGVPVLDQFSARPATTRFAEALARRVGRETGRRWVVCPVSTGAEATDLALKHAALHRAARLAALERGWRHGGAPRALVDEVTAHNRSVLQGRSPVVIALQRGFHGRSLGALLATGSDEHRAPFTALLGVRTVFLDPRGTDEARTRLAQTVAHETVRLHGLVTGPGGVSRVGLPFLDVLATIAEPVQGEGGVVEVPPEWLAQLRLPGVPFILDEIQCGMGRTGTFLACADPAGARVVPDCLLLGKSLGGGVAKLAALLVDRAHYVEAMDEHRATTYGEDSFSSTVGMAVLRVMDREDVPGRARRAGERLRAVLEDVHRDHPDAVVAVRGRGLLLGVELRVPRAAGSAILEAIAARGLGHLAASYLLHRHRVRVLPTTSAPDVLRVEPSAFLRDAEVEWTARAFRALAAALAGADLLELTAHLAGHAPAATRRPSRERRLSAFRTERQPAAEGARRVAFVHHFIHPTRELVGDSPSLAALGTARRLELVRRFQVLCGLEPLVTSSANLFDGRAWLLTITLPVTAAEMQHLRADGRGDFLLDRLQDAADIARRHGCGVVALGGHTSVVSRDGTLLAPPPGTRVVSGNSFTTAVLVRQVRKLAAEAGMSLERGHPQAARIAVVGALGNIGSAVVELLAGRRALGRSVLLVGRPGSEARLEERAAQLRADGVEAAWSTHMLDLEHADVVVAAVSSPEPVIRAEHLAAERPVLVVDVSQPRATAPRLARERRNARVVGAGLVALPRDPRFRFSPYTAPGTLFACAAEGLLAALAEQQMELTGRIRRENIEALDELAAGLGLFGRLVTEE